jgi:molybdenum cofactor synthesis domain-containing protein
MADRVTTVGILTISDGCFQGTRVDRSGDTIAEWCSRHGYEVIARRVVPDESQAIVPLLLEWCDRDQAHLVLTTGGTGFSPRDVTPEATAAVIERDAPGVAESIRSAGVEKTPHAALSRGRAGIRGSTLIVNLPGSPGGVSDGLAVLDRLATHGIALARDEPTVHDPAS